MINPRDKYLTAAGEMGSGIRILQQDLWEMIISFLISQQNNITRIKKCIENISREFGVRKTSSTGAEYYAFPTAEALALAIFSCRSYKAFREKSPVSEIQCKSHKNHSFILFF